MTAPWTISLVGGLAVTRPDGTPAAFRTRKASALLALLVLRKGMALSRVAIGEALWPSVPSSRRSTNVRQALAHVREAMGAESPVVISRTSCRVDMARVLCPDLDAILADPIMSRQALPEMIEPWFDVWRRNLAYSEHGVGDVNGLDQRFHNGSAASLINVLDWCIHYRPKAALEIVRALPELAQAAPPGEMIKVMDAVLAVVPATDPLFGWGLFQRAVALAMVGQADRSLAQLFAAKEHAVAHKERDLFVETCFYYASAQLVTGESALAQATLKEANEMKLGRGSPARTVRLRHGLGLALVHNGEFRQGLDALRKAYEQCDEREIPFERAYVAANLAWLEATCGNLKRARRVLDQVRTMQSASSWRIMLTCFLAEAACALAENRIDEARERSAQAIQLGEGYVAPGFLLYAHELNALCSLKVGDTDMALRHWNKSKTLRHDGKVQLTVWDRHRLRDLLEAESSGR